MTSVGAARGRSPGEDEIPRPALEQLPKPPADVVPRPRLLDRLDEGTLDSVLTLLSAPPGAGKTVLLGSWLRERIPDRRIAWVQLREGDRTPVWQRLLDAARPDGGPASPPAPVGGPADDGSLALAEEFVATLEQRSEPLVLVVDDLHYAPPAALAALDRVVRAPPSALRLVAASRIDPPLSLHLLRVTGDLAEIRAHELAFTAAEAGVLFARMGLELDERDLRAVLDRTEGWATGLRLFGLSLLAHAGDRDLVERLIVDERPVAEFLAAEVLGSQTSDVRGFLLRTSILDAVDGPLANELTGRSDGERVLEQLFRDNVFIERVAGPAHVYRYHQLFGALLRAEVAYELGDELPALHRLAAVSLARRGHAIAAVRHAVEAEQWELAAALVAEHWSAVFAADDGISPFETLDRLPLAAAADSPVLAAFTALTRIGSASPRGEAALLADAEARRDDVPEAVRPGFEALLRYAAALAARGRGTFKQASKLAGEALERGAVETSSSEIEEQRRALYLATKGAAELWEGSAEEAQSLLEEAVDVARRTGTAVAEIDALAHLALLELCTGQLRRAARIARAALELERTHGRSLPAGVVARVVLALVQHAWGDLDAADAALASAITLTRRSGDLPGRALAAVAAASVALSESGDAADDALLHLRAMRRRRPAAGLLDGRIAALEARLLAKTARLDEAAAVVAEPGSDPHQVVAAARIRLALGQPVEAVAFLEQRQGGNAYVEIEARVTEAIARRMSGDEAQAAAALELALALAEPELVRRPFLDAGGAVRELLGAHLRRTNTHRWLAADLVALLDGRNAADGIAPAELLEALSDRETEVLHYLPTIMSNADIAAELFVSVNTVKTHVKSIYRKLGATRRQDAVRRARQLRLL
jgi:LuxR family transcriptional regulator, maltose regulon positive regulatory protein